MAGHHEHTTTEQKPVAFTVPLILAIVAIFIIVLVLSVCDPKTGHGGAHENKAHSGQHDAAASSSEHGAEGVHETEGTTAH